MWFPRDLSGHLCLSCQGPIREVVGNHGGETYPNKAIESLAVSESALALSI